MTLSLDLVSDSVFVLRCWHEKQNKGNLWVSNSFLFPPFPAFPNRKEWSARSGYPQQFQSECVDWCMLKNAKNKSRVSLFAVERKLWVLKRTGCFYNTTNCQKEIWWLHDPFTMCIKSYWQRSSDKAFVPWRTVHSSKADYQKIKNVGWDLVLCIVCWLDIEKWVWHSSVCRWTWSYRGGV